MRWPSLLETLMKRTAHDRLGKLPKGPFARDAYIHGRGKTSREFLPDAWEQYVSERFVDDPWFKVGSRSFHAKGRVQ